MTDRPDIDADRLLADLEALGQMGADPATGALSRLAFTPEDRSGRDFIAGLLREIGMEARIDAVGNLFALRGDPTVGCVLAGSHTDTVGAAGRYDGALGVLAAVAALRAVVSLGIETRRPIGLVSFVNEEGVRFMPDMMGSLFVRGDLSIDTIRAIRGIDTLGAIRGIDTLGAIRGIDTLGAIRGIDGETIGEALDRTGMAGRDDLRHIPVRAFVELHIEQGPVLDETGTDIGVVTGVQGLRWLRCILQGAANHAGTTPMSSRRDAGLVAAFAAMEARRLTAEIPGLRATVGQVRYMPGLVNVIPGRSECTVDLRHPEPAALDRAHDLIRERILAFAAEERVEVRFEELAHAAPVTFDAEIVETIDRAAASRGFSRRRLLSGAGHDAQIVSRTWPTAMIFVPSRDGVSHSPLEYTSPEACIAGARVLLDSMLALADTA